VNLKKGLIIYCCTICFLSRIQVKVAVEGRRADLNRRCIQSLVEIKIIYGPPIKLATITSLVQRSAYIFKPPLYRRVYTIMPSDNLCATALNKS
jgi:hypothetical protein